MKRLPHERLSFKYKNYDKIEILHCRNVCGVRVRVELSTGKVRPKPWMRGGGGGGRGPPGRMRRPYDPNDRCYECGERGHYAYDCTRYRRGGRGGGRSR